MAVATHGQVIEALVANRLTSPQPLLHIEDWAREWAMSELFGVEPTPNNALNDDRVGRALDAVAPALGGIVGSVGVNAIARFGIDVSRIHWDMTSMSLFGAYANNEDGLRRAVPRHPKDRRVNLKQIQTGLGVSAGGGIPIFHRASTAGPARSPRWSGSWSRCGRCAPRGGSCWSVCLLTNLNPADADAGEVLIRYKGQEFRRTPLRQLRGTPGRRSHLLEEPAHRGAPEFHLSGPAHLLPRRTPGPPRPRTRGDDDRLPRSAPRPAPPAN